MTGIGDAWKDLVQQTLRAGCLIGNQGREIYREWVSFESAQNITELQLGVVARKTL